MTKCVFSLHGDRAKISSDDKKLLVFVRTHLTIANPAAKYSERAPTHVSLINGYYAFDIGALDLIKAQVLLYNPNVEIVIDENLKLRYSPLSAQRVSFDTSDFKIRDYQKECVDRCLSKGRGLIESPTASGKSYIMYNLVRNLIHHATHPVKILILVPTTLLVKQLKHDFVQYGEPEGMTSMFSSSKGNTIPHDTEVIISNRQWLQGHFEDLPEITHIIVDEVQMLGQKTNAVTKFVRNLKTNMRFGFSGTIPTDIEKYWSCVSAIGEVLFSEKAHQMIERGVCADIDINHICIHFNHVPVFEIDAENFKIQHVLERRWLQESFTYRSVMHGICNGITGNTLLIFGNISYGQQLHKEFLEKSPGKKVFYIDGSVPVDERMGMIEYMESNNDVILLAQSKTFSEGVNVKNLDNIVIDLGKALTGIIQTIGRSLRKVKDTSTATIYDVHTNMRYSANHYAQRCILYKEHYDVTLTKETLLTERV